MSKPRIFLCLVTLELWLPEKVQSCCIFAATKENFDFFLKKLFHSITSHTYHHNSSWPFKQAQKHLWSKLVSNAKDFLWYYFIPETLSALCLFSQIKLGLFGFLPAFNCFSKNGK